MQHHGTRRIGLGSLAKMDWACPHDQHHNHGHGHVYYGYLWVFFNIHINRVK